MTKKIDVVPYDANWPHIFEAEIKFIKEVLGDDCLKIHHIGSTSVKGLWAKPVIDHELRTFKNYRFFFKTFFINF